MKISETETYVRRYVRNGGDDTRYKLDAIHVGIQAVANDFLFRTKIPTSGVVALSSGSASLPSLASLTGILPENVKRAYITNLSGLNCDQTVNLKIIDYVSLSDMLLNDSNTGVPQYIAFDSTSTGKVYPTPDAAYTVHIDYAGPFTSWTPGSPLLLPAISGGAVASVAVNSSGVTTYGSTPTVAITGGGGTGATATATLTSTLVTAIVVTAGGTGYTSVPTITVNGVTCNDSTLNLPDSYLVTDGGILLDGVRANLQGSEPENATLVKLSTDKYERFVMRMLGRGSGSFGQHTIYRKSPTELRRARLRGGL